MNESGQSFNLMDMTARERTERLTALIETLDSFIGQIESLEEIKIRRMKRVPSRLRLKRKRSYRKNRSRIKRKQKLLRRKPRSKRLAKRRVKIRKRLKLRPGSRKRISLA